MPRVKRDTDARGGGTGARGATGPRGRATFAPNPEARPIAPPALPLAAQTAIVTGGGTGVGAAIALELAERGARVVVTGRRREPIDAVAARHERIEARVCDATDAGATEALAREWRPSVAVANAGIARSAPFARTEPEALRRMWEVNVMGVHALFAAALRAREGEGPARLIAIASTAGLRGYPYVAGYCATKHAVVGLVRALALELAAKPATRAVTANAVCPGYTDTPMLRDTIRGIVEKTGRSVEEAEAPLRAHNPQDRFVEPAEVADAVAWLAGDAARSVTGQAISVSGGEVM